ncbi:Conserved hypothetical protein 95 [Desulfuromusa kysingii]|uniref:16S rRNA (Guanine(966)-N(2))-methyltransferase RsmD n=1 Tax=Desulfuromusa kysingii TaxID=37625 RepID=A0A1H4D200_9BACT|nr:16S rRNA (guanine(966)-N(2))-methyltransferase RsmD [Desulfuromusa kysingii]SEA66667.1 Conserved hypothetical protein 95 [Desulfuromusa kysingii]
MRIISGIARGRQLATFSGLDIRPTPDRVREAIFSILTSKLETFHGTNVLELFAGSGAQSLEALSRGAKCATLVDSGKTAAKVMIENIKRCRFEAETRVINQDVFATLPQLITMAPFDLILLDPPYHQNLLANAIEQIEHLKLLGKKGIICAESCKDESLCDFKTLRLMDERTYGSSKIHFLCLT